MNKIKLIALLLLTSLLTVSCEDTLGDNYMSTTRGILNAMLYLPETEPMRRKAQLAVQVFKDFCEGRLERKPNHRLTRVIQRKRGILSPSHIYNKFYKQKGWTRERVENAWRGLHGVLKNYLDGKLPSYVNNPLNRTNKVSKSEGDWSEMCRIFEERHSLPYSVYRHLRRKGLVPKLGAGEDYVDLSKYMFDAFAY